MAKLALSTRLFAGAIVYLAEEAVSTSDAATKPSAESAAWLEVGLVQTLKHAPDVLTEPYSEITANGWRNLKDEYTLADVFELTTREVSELFHRLQMGTNAALVAGTAQAPFTKSDRKIRGWIKLQHRQHSGTDRLRMDVFCEIRLKTPPDIEKKTVEPVFELYVLNSSLNSVIIPS
jgi:hypothetical protein